MLTTDFNWLSEQNSDFFEPYKGKWIAVADKEVIGVGQTASEAADQARTTNPGKKFILEAVDTEADVVYPTRTV